MAVIEDGLGLHAVEAWVVDPNNRYEAIARALVPTTVGFILFHRAIQGEAYFGSNYMVSPRPTTRKRLKMCLHEYGHMTLHHITVPGGRDQSTARREYEAERWALAAMTAAGLTVTAAETERARRNVFCAVAEDVLSGIDADPEAAAWCGIDADDIDRWRQTYEKAKAK